MKEEIKIKGSADPVSIATTENILNQMKTSICKIKLKGATGTGFFCKIPFIEKQMIYCLMTNYHVINEKFINENKTINLLLNDDKEALIIDLSIKRKFYFNKDYDITLIELKQIGKVKEYLELDDNLFKDNEEVFYEDKSIYVLQYPNGKNACVSYGLLNNIYKFDIKHTCSTDYGSSGSPILNLENNKVIGIHKKGSTNFNYNLGTLLKLPLNDFFEENKKIIKNININYKSNANIIWIDENIDNKENIIIINKLENIFKNIKLKLFKKIDESINYLESIIFEETKVIVGDKLYSKFISQFKKNINNIYCAPKIIIFTTDREKFIKSNKEYKSKENRFYSYNGVATTINDIILFVNDDDKIFEKIESSLSFKFQSIESDIYKKTDIESTFEYIDSKEKLMLPLLFKELIKKLSIDNMKEYTNYLCNTFFENKKVKELLGPIISVSNIPIEIIAKYYARLFTLESNFYKDMNRDLRLNQIEKYLQYIKTLYEGVKLQSLPLVPNCVLYRGARISIDEIIKIKDYINNKILSFPIVFCKSFLSFAFQKNIAEYFLLRGDKKINVSKVLYILEIDNNIGYNLSTHCVISKKLDYFHEGEVLFFPFSAFEIKNIRKKIRRIYKYNEELYEIRLLYLGKYLSDIENDKIFNL